MVLFLGEELAILFKSWTPKSLPSPFAAFPGGHLPEAVFIEACFDRTCRVLIAECFVVESVELPLPCDGRFVAGRLEEMGEGFFFRIEISKVGVVSEVVLSGHELDAGGGADGSRVAMVEADTLGGEGIEVGSFVVVATVAGEAFPGDVIGHNQNDVWPMGGKP